MVIKKQKMKKGNVQNPSSDISPQSQFNSSYFLDLCYTIYTELRERKNKPILCNLFPKPENALHKLYLDGFNCYEVYEQFALNDENLVVDFMEEIESDEEEEKINYEGFFDVPNKNYIKNPSSNENKDMPDELEGMEDDDDGHDEEKENFEEEPKENFEIDETHPSEDRKSTLQKELEKERTLRQHHESANISEKHWTLKGEVRAQDRPQNSVLNQCLDFASGAKMHPAITEEFNREMEKLLASRFRTRTFDSVVRKRKVTKNPYEYKKSLVLDQEKSSKSLSEIYEEDYLRAQRLEKAKDMETEPSEHKALREEWRQICEFLDALTNSNYTPKEARVDLKVVSNLPSIAMEEATPTAFGDADQLAPQEIMAPQKGELKGVGEKTSTDKKRERRQKKTFQHHKYKDLERRLDANVKKAKKEGTTLDVDTSNKIVRKALKIGSVKMLDSGKNVKSSQSFFKQLGETHEADTNRNKRKRGQK